MLRGACRSALGVARRGVAQHAEVVDKAAAGKVAQKIAGEVSDARSRLFAVVYLNGRQWKVGQNDLIALEGNLPLAVGDKIKLDKVMMVGGKNFSVFGRPMLDASQVRVEATVVEKMTKSPELNYAHYNHKQIHIVNWMSDEMTVVRVNDITANPGVVGEQ